MRKAMIVTLALLVLTVGGVCFAASGVYEAHDQVVLTENTVYGDRAAANGLTVQLSSTYAYHLFWDTTYTVDAQPRTQTEYSFSASGVYESQPVTYSGVYMDSMPGFGMDQDAVTGLGLAYQELCNSIGPGEEKSATVYLKDYADYYPISVTLDFPGTRCSIEGDQAIDTQDPGTERYAMDTIRDYFKIPVLEEEQYHISVEKYAAGNGNSSSGGVDMTYSDHYSMQVFSDLTDNACYFTFDAHTEQGKVVDTGEIPGGYGIYRLPYAEERYDESKGKVCGVDVDGLEMVYPLDPEIELLFLHVNPEQTKLLLHAIEDGKYMLTVIDLETMDTLQKLEIAAWPEGGWQIYDEGDYMAVLLFGSQQLAVIAAADSGAYELRFLCDIRPDDLEYFPTGRDALAFDGERLAVAGILSDDEYGSYTCDFSLAVYEKSGLVYYGEYQNSLNASRGQNDRCRGSNDPLSLNWNAGS